MYLHKPAERGSIDTTRNCVGAGSRKIASRKPTIVSPIKAHASLHRVEPLLHPGSVRAAEDVPGKI